MFAAWLTMIVSYLSHLAVRGTPTSATVRFCVSVGRSISGFCLGLLKRHVLGPEKWILLANLVAKT